MRKANKILMATVAILLCLVLITTSVASGIFAKFVITKSGETTITFERFGVTVTMTPATSKLEAVGATIPKENNQVKETFTSTGYTITITGIKLKPGDDLTDAVRFEFVGKPTVTNVKIKITPTIIYSSTIHALNTSEDGKTTYYNYYIPNQNANRSSNKNTNLGGTKYYMPIGFTFSAAGTTADENYVVDPWKESTDKTTKVSASAIQTALRDGIKDKITGATIDTDNTDAIVFTPTIGTESISFTIDGASVSGFNLGFAYPKEHGSTADDILKYDRISTFMGDHIHADASITVSYKVEIVQT